MSGRHHRAAPDGFAHAAAVTGNKALQRMFSAGQETIRRWLEECACTERRRTSTLRSVRPMPDDFPAHAVSMSLLQLRRHYHVGEAMVKRWHRENGGNPRGLFRAAPTGFADLAPGMTRKALAAHYQCGVKLIAHWLEETGAMPSRSYTKPGRKLRVAPADLAQTAPQMGQRSLAEHYHTTRDVIARWLREINFTSPRFGNQRGAKLEQKLTRKVNSIATNPWTKVHHDDLRNHTRFDEAADALRRERFVVYRCTETGVYMEKGFHWRVGNVVVTPDELLQRAEKYRSRAA